MRVASNEKRGRVPERDLPVGDRLRLPVHRRAAPAGAPGVDRTAHTRELRETPSTSAASHRPECDDSCSQPRAVWAAGHDRAVTRALRALAPHRVGQVMAIRLDVLLHGLPATATRPSLRRRLGPRRPQRHVGQRTPAPAAPLEPCGVSGARANHRDGRRPPSDQVGELRMPRPHPRGVLRPVSEQRKVGELEPGRHGAADQGIGAERARRLPAARRDDGHRPRR